MSANLSSASVRTACGSGRLTLDYRLAPLQINRPLPQAVLTSLTLKKLLRYVCEAFATSY